jgi:hypothetical protein
MATTPVTLTQQQIDDMIEAGIAKALAARKSGFSWAALRGNPYFVTFTSTLAGAIGSELYQAIQAGGFTWTLKAIEGMVVTGLGLAAGALYHLYQNPPAVAAAVKRDSLA